MPPVTTKESIGLGNVDNTSDADKPISTATQTALNGKLNNSGGTLTGNLTLSSSGSSAGAPREIIISGAAGQFARIGVSATGNSIQSGNGQITQISSWFRLDLGGDRQVTAPAFIAGSLSENISTRIFSSRPASRPLVVQGFASQSSALTEWWDSSGSVLSSVLADGTLDVRGNTHRLRTSRTPASATAAGNQGDHCWDANYFYNAPATNAWQRVIRNTTASPAQLTANQNNWAPTIAKTWRVSTDAARDITGINIGQWGGDEHYLVNVGSNNVVLKHQDTNSTAAYRFISVTGADITLAAGEMAFLWYDSTSLRWRIAKV